MSEETHAPEAMELSIRPGTERFDSKDERWLDQVAQFVGAMERDVGGTRKVTTPEPGQKGGADSLILALGSAGAFRMAIEFFRAWLSRDRTRSLEINWTDGTENHQVVIQGEADQASFAKLAEAAATRLRQD